MSVSYGGDSITFADGSVQSGGWTGMRNRIINGAMVIDQRNAGASVTLNGNLFGVDRWGTQASQNSKATMQQSTTASTGFSNSLLVTSSSAYSPTSSDYFWLYQTIEGFNIADLGWGSASAQTITLSFWVRASVTGTYSVRVGNSTRSYVSTYTINSANTFEYKTITIAGDTSGTWGTTNSQGIQLQYDLGCGSTRTTSTTNAWQAGDLQKATGSVSVVSTSGATLYITGVQLERGSTASSFEYRPYGTELALCQRYYEKSYNIDVVPATNTTVGWFVIPAYSPSNEVSPFPCVFQVTKRTAPSISLYTASGTVDRVDIVNTSSTTSVSTTANGAGTRSFRGWIAIGTTGSASLYITGFHFIASAEL